MCRILVEKNCPPSLPDVDAGVELFESAIERRRASRRSARLPRPRTFCLRQLVIVVRHDSRRLSFRREDEFCSLLEEERRSICGLDFAKFGTVEEVWPFEVKPVGTLDVNNISLLSLAFSRFPFLLFCPLSVNLSFFNSFGVESLDPNRCLSFDTKCNVE